MVIITRITILAKSVKHTGFCVVGIDDSGKWVRLVRDDEGHALPEEDCKFEKLDIINADAAPAPLPRQPENHILNEVYSTTKGRQDLAIFEDLLDNWENECIFYDDERFLPPRRCLKGRPSITAVSVNDFEIYQHSEGTYKASFICNSIKYKDISVTDPEYMRRACKLKRATIIATLPGTPFSKYGRDLYYKFVCAVYPLDSAR